VREQEAPSLDNCPTSRVIVKLSLDTYSLTIRITTRVGQRVSSAGVNVTTRASLVVRAKVTYHPPLSPFSQRMILKTASI